MGYSLVMVYCLLFHMIQPISKPFLHEKTELELTPVVCSNFGYVL